MKFQELYSSETRRMYEVAMSVIAIEKFFDPDTTDSELLALDLGYPQFGYYEGTVTGFTTVVQSADPEEEEPIYYHLTCVYHNDRIYAIMTHCPECQMFEIDPVTWEAKQYNPNA